MDLLFANSMRVKGDFGAKGLDQASDRLDTLKLSDAARRDYERYRNNASHYSSAIQTAIEEGEVKKTREMILGMHKKGFSKEDMADIAEMTVAEVEKILNAG